MPRYRFTLPVRAIGGFRLTEGGLTVQNIALMPAIEPACIARVDSVQADHVEQAYAQAQHLAEQLFGYLALLGDDAAFILDGREGLQAINLDLRENPIPADQPPPRFETIGGVVAIDGQELMGQLHDPDGTRRRSGALLVFNSRATYGVGAQRLEEVTGLFLHRARVPTRVRTALGILHDAACSREPASAFAQTYTALEVLTEHLRPLVVLDAFYQDARDRDVVAQLPYKTKDDLLAALRILLTSAALSPQQVERVVSYAAITQSRSQVDVIHDYLAGLGIPVERSQINQWRRIRGRLVHAAEAGAEEGEAMRGFRAVVRAAVMEELRRAVPG